MKDELRWALEQVAEVRGTFEAAWRVGPVTDTMVHTAATIRRALTERFEARIREGEG